MIQICIYQNKTLRYSEQHDHVCHSGTYKTTLLHVSAPCPTNIYFLLTQVREICFFFSLVNIFPFLRWIEKMIYSFCLWWTIFWFGLFSLWDRWYSCSCLLELGILSWVSMGLRIQLLVVDVDISWLASPFRNWLRSVKESPLIAAAGFARWSSCS